MNPIKKLHVYHRRIVDGGREYLERYLKRQYHAANVEISNGEAHIEWFAGAEGDSKDVNVFCALARTIMTSKDGPLPPTWKEVAEHWILAGITIEQVEELLQCDMIDIPQEFFDYAKEVEDGYYAYCASMNS